jgi:hypothetical protein
VIVGVKGLSDEQRRQVLGALETALKAEIDPRLGVAERAS